MTVRRSEEMRTEGGRNKELTNSGMKNTSGMVVKVLLPLGRNSIV